LSAKKDFDVHIPSRGTWWIPGLQWISRWSWRRFFSSAHPGCVRLLYPKHLSPPTLAAQSTVPRQATLRCRDAASRRVVLLFRARSAVKEQWLGVRRLSQPPIKLSRGRLKLSSLNNRSRFSPGSTYKTISSWS